MLYYKKKELNNLFNKIREMRDESEAPCMRFMDRKKPKKIDGDRSIEEQLVGIAYSRT